MAKLPRHASDLYALVPKDAIGNLSWRKKLMRKVTVDPEFASQLRAVCRLDFFFWVNSFVWTINPKRPHTRKKVPFITIKGRKGGSALAASAVNQLAVIAIERMGQSGSG